MWSCSAQMPLAVVDDVRVISGMWPWCTVTVPASVCSRNSTTASPPLPTPPPHATARLLRVHDHIVGEELAQACPVLGVHGAEVARLQLLDRLNVIHPCR